MIEDYLKILALSNYKKDPSKLNDIIVLKAYKLQLANLDELIKKDINLKMNSQYKIMEAFYHEAYRVLATEESRNEYFRKVEKEELISSLNNYNLEGNVRRKTPIGEIQKEVNQPIHNEEDFARIINYMNQQTKKLEAKSQIDCITIKSGKNGKAEFIRGETTKDVKKKVIQKEDEERA